MPDDYRWDDHAVELISARRWDPKLHPRVKAGSFGGGRFLSISDPVRRRAAMAQSNIRAIRDAGKGTTERVQRRRDSRRGGLVGKAIRARAGSRLQKVYAKKANIEGRDYDEHDREAMKSYINQEETLVRISEVLRGGKKFREGSAPDQLMKKLDRAINAKKLTEPTTVFRGVGDAKLVEGLEVGSTFSDKYYTSTSLDPDVAGQFHRGQLAGSGAVGAAIGREQKAKGNPGGTFEYRLPKGQPVGVAGDRAHGAEYSFVKQAEYVLPRGMKWKVVEKRKASTGAPHFVLEPA